MVNGHYLSHRDYQLTGLEPGLDEVVLRLGGGLGQEPVVHHAALLGLVPGDIHVIMTRVTRVTRVLSPVEVSVVSAPGAGVVIAAAHIVALGVAVIVVGAAHAPAPASGAQSAVGDLCVPGSH